MPSAQRRRWRWWRSQNVGHSGAAPADQTEVGGDAVCSDFAWERRGCTLPGPRSPTCTWLSRPCTADVAVGYGRFLESSKLARCVDPHCPHRPSERSLSLCSLFFFCLSTPPPPSPSLSLTDCANSRYDRERLYTVFGCQLQPEAHCCTFTTGAGLNLQQRINRF